MRPRLVPFERGSSAARPRLSVGERGFQRPLAHQRLELSKRVLRGWLLHGPHQIRLPAGSISGESRSSSAAGGEIVTTSAGTKWCHGDERTSHGERDLLGQVWRTNEDPDFEVLMTGAPVLVTGATGRVGRVVIDHLLDAGVPVRALTRGSEAEATLPADVEVVTGDLTAPESLDAGLRGVRAVFLVWT